MGQNVNSDDQAKFQYRAANGKTTMYDQPLSESDRRYLARFAGKTTEQRKAMVAKDESDRDADSANVQKAKADKEIDKAVSLKGSFKKGGKVKKTGAYKVHKGERVLTVSEAKQYQKRGASGKKKSTRYKR